MSAEKKIPNTSTLLCIGEKSDLGEEISAGFSKIGCSVYWKKYTEVVGGLGDTSPPPRYVCIFAPTIHSEKSKNIQKDFGNIFKVAKVFSRSKSRLVYITPHPNDLVIDLNSHSQSSKYIKNYSEELVRSIHLLKQNKFKITIGMIRDLVTQSIQDTPSVINKAFSTLPHFIQLSKSESYNLYPITARQTVEIIKRILLTKSTSQTVVKEIRGKNNISNINFILKIKKSFEDQTGKTLKIETINEKEEVYLDVKITHPKDDFPSLSSQIAERVRNEIANKKSRFPVKKIVDKNKQKKVKKVERSPKPLKKRSRKKKLNKLRKLVSKASKKRYILITLLSTSFIWVLIQGIYISTLYQSLRGFQEGDIEKTRKKMSIIQILHPVGKYSLSITNMFIQKSTSSETVQMGDDLIRLVDLYMKSASLAGEITNKGNQIFLGIMDSQKIDVFSQIDALMPKINTAHEVATSIQISLQKLKSKNKNEEVDNLISSSITKLKKASVYIDSAKKIGSISSEILGKESKKTYIVLLQNNAELRATGGFIGSFALMSFDKGKMYDIETFDVYSADGQLRGHVEPPEEIKKYLGEANWYLRDSNFNPDFPTTARRVEWFLNKEINRQVDGVVGINLLVVQDLLEAVGGVEVADYQEVITKENILQRAQYKSELNFFDGSTQKKDFIASLINALYFKILDGEGDYREKIIAAIVKSAETKQLSLSIRDKKTDDILQDTIFSGKTIQPRCEGVIDHKCINDFVQVVESNFGVNKVNYFIERSMSHQVDIGQGKITHMVQTSLKNTAQTPAWPAGSYKNYIRFYIPADAVLKKAEVDGQGVPIKNISIKKENDKKSIGFLVSIPIAQQKIISIEYDLAFSREGSEQKNYQLYLQKQSGLTNDPIQITISNQQHIPKTTNMGEIIDSKVSISTHNTYDQKIITSY